MTALPTHQRLSLRGAANSFVLITAAALLTASTCRAAILHGRVKDQQCSVLSRVSIRIQPLHAQPTDAPRVLSTDSSGDYTIDLAPGAYHVCMQRDRNTAATCQEIDIPASGDTWITTQLRDAAPDLSNLGNRSY